MNRYLTMIETFARRRPSGWNGIEIEKKQSLYSVGAEELSSGG
jgi:hypothetical protein